MLKIQFKDKRHPPLWVVEKLYSIGSAADNQLVVTDSGIDPLHARLISGDDKIFLKDNNSSSGCFVNGQRVTNKEIFPGDVIRLGSVELEVLDPSSQAASGQEDEQQHHWRLVSDSSWLAGQSFAVPSNKTVVIGRGTQSDIVIPGTHLSRRHAELTVKGKFLQIKDLASANGTFINDKRIDNAVAHSGDRLRLDVYTFRLVGPEVDEKNKTRVRPPIESLSKSVERKQASSEPKRWKTRPTSPGNRTEPTYEQWQRKNDIWLWFILVAIVGGLIATVYLL